MADVPTGESRDHTFGKVYSFLGLTIATLSVVKLIEYGFHFGLGEVLHRLMSYYERLSELAFGWSEPWIAEQLHTLRQYVGLDLHLHPHWRYVFILLWLYVVADLRAKTNNIDPSNLDVSDRRGRYWVARMVSRLILTFSFGGFVALLAGIAAGVVPIGVTRHDGVWSSALIALIPVLAYVTIRIGTYVLEHWDYFDMRDFRPLLQRSAFAILLFALVSIALATNAKYQWAPIFGNVPNSPLVIILCFMLGVAAIAIYESFHSAWVLSGIEIVREKNKRTQMRSRKKTFRVALTSFIHHRRKDTNYQRGAYIFIVLVAAAAFMLANAGLTLVGL